MTLFECIMANGIAHYRDDFGTAITVHRRSYENAVSCGVVYRVVYTRPAVRLSFPTLEAASAYIGDISQRKDWH